MTRPEPALRSADTRAAAWVEDVDAVLILGKELRRDPCRGMAELKARSAAAAVLLRMGVPWVVSLEAPLRGQLDAGSALVARLLAELGVDAERLVRAQSTRSTREEALHGAALARARRWRRLLVLTAGYHQPRAAAYFDAVAPGLSRVLAPEQLLPFAQPGEAEWIRQGLPDAEALASEARVERSFSAMARALSPLPAPWAWSIEVAAGALLRGVHRPSGRR